MKTESAEDSRSNVTICWPGYEQEQTALKEKLVSITQRISELDTREKCIQKFIAKAKEYMEMPKLTPELLRVFIRKIEVHKKFRKYSRTEGNLINIYYAFQLPEHKGVPALEVLLPKRLRESA